jgi:hypothetical protein
MSLKPNLGLARAERQAHGGKAILFLDRSRDKDAFSARSRDISVSGVFLETPAPVQVGEEVDLMLGGRNNRALRAAARVVRVSADGFGARFLPESGEEQAVLTQFVDSLRG